MPRLLIVHHSPTPSVSTLTEAVVAGASIAYIKVRSLATTMPNARRPTSVILR